MNFRQQVVNAFIERFGEPDRGPDPHGTIYRWQLKRERGMDVHVIINSPEVGDMAHVLISDPSREATEMVRSIKLFTMEEAKRAIDHIEDEWKKRGIWYQGGKT